MNTEPFNPDNLYSIGRITRTHGVGGKVELQFTDDVFDRADAPYLFLEMDGLPVPYYWEEYSFKNQHAALFKFEYVDTETQARALMGARVFYDRRYAPHTLPDMNCMAFFTGFSVRLPDGREVGRVLTVDDSSANVLLTLLTPDGEEVMLPFHPDLVQACDESRRELVMDVPEALLHLNRR